MSDYADLEPVEDLEILDEELEVIEELRTDRFIPSKTDEIDLYSKFRKNYEKSYLPMITMDKALRITCFNEAFHKNLVKQANVAGYSFFQIVDQFDKAEQTINIHQSLKTQNTGFSWKGRVKFSHKAFLNIEANALISPIFPEDGKTSAPVGYLCIFDDVTEENQTILHNTFLSLLEASKLKDNDTGYHIKRVGEYSRLMSKWLFQNKRYPEIDAQFIEDITFLAPMHDVGKIGTPDEILHKTGALEEREWEIMKEHTINGGFILSSYPSIMANQIPLFHHERWDGKGYPYQFSEEMIPLPARIVAIADVYDALRMERSYKKSFSHKKACGIIKKDSGSHFDPNLVEVFFELEHRFEDTFNILSDTV